jgi:hypothetical protein
MIAALVSDDAIEKYTVNCLTKILIKLAFVTWLFNYNENENNYYVLKI